MRVGHLQLEGLLRGCFEADPARRPTAGAILKVSVKAFNKYHEAVDSDACLLSFLAQGLPHAVAKHINTFFSFVTDFDGF